MARASISVDTAAISGLANDLKNLYNDFDGVPEFGDDLNASIGSPVVQDAVHEFATNWNSRRKRLLESVGAVRDHAQTAHESFSKVDLELFNNILGKKG
ncbi:hypothetical protein BH11ACT2_BH11ACT2_16240 [soil metagenome]